MENFPENMLKFNVEFIAKSEFIRRVSNHTKTTMTKVAHIGTFQDIDHREICNPIELITIVYVVTVLCDAFYRQKLGCELFVLFFIYFIYPICMQKSDRTSSAKVHE